MKLIDCRKKRKQEKFKKTHLSLQSSSSLLLYTHFVYRLESITKWDYRIIKCYAMASISHYSRIHSHSALINGHSFSAIFFLFSGFSSPFCLFFLFTSAWHFASCAITKYSHCTVDVSAWRASTLYRSLHTISKIFWPSFGDDLISSLSLSVECGRGGVGRERWLLEDKDDASSPALGSMSCSPSLLVSLSLLLPSMFFFSHAHFSVF